MNCWTAMVRIVESYNRTDKPWLGIIALTLIVALLVGLAVVAKGVGSLLLPQKDAVVATIDQKAAQGNTP